MRRLSAKEATAYSGQGFVWVHIDGADEADLSLLKNGSGIPDVAASALVATETRPRCDQFDNGALVNLRGLGETDTQD
ncbi:MAG TPA: CorA family divalent cation transporter, partial [Allosphingosinicella sp.]|nr:CorA family divalent cation transporter [Allosphingosinicella sp.]